MIEALQISEDARKAKISGKEIKKMATGGMSKEEEKILVFHKEVFSTLKASLNASLSSQIMDNTRGLRRGRKYMKTYRLTDFANLNFGFEPKSDYRQVLIFVHDNSPGSAQYSMVFGKLRDQNVADRLKDQHGIKIREVSGYLIKEEERFSSWDDLTLARKIGKRLAVFIEIVGGFLDMEGK